MYTNIVKRKNKSTKKTNEFADIVNNAGTGFVPLMSYSENSHL
jgi:hypothetical protein